VEVARGRCVLETIGIDPTEDAQANLWPMSMESGEPGGSPFPEEVGGNMVENEPKASMLMPRS
jgi:hypothetical protein